MNQVRGGECQVSSNKYTHEAKITVLTLCAMLFALSSVA